MQHGRLLCHVMRATTGYPPACGSTHRLGTKAIGRLPQAG
jgi:hypothetical protein